MKPTIVLVHGAFGESASWNLLNSTVDVLELVGFSTRKDDA